MSLDPDTVRMLREAFGDLLIILPPYDEVRVVSIQIVDAANPAARKELRERIGGLNLAREMVWHDRNDSEENRAESLKQYHEQLKGLYHALTGYQLTEEEVKELSAFDLQPGGGN